MIVRQWWRVYFARQAHRMFYKYKNKQHTYIKYLLYDNKTIQQYIQNLYTTASISQMSQLKLNSSKIQPKLEQQPSDLLESINRKLRSKTINQNYPPQTQYNQGQNTQQVREGLNKFLNRNDRRANRYSQSHSLIKPSNLAQIDNSNINKTAQTNKLSKQRSVSYHQNINTHRNNRTRNSSVLAAAHPIHGQSGSAGPLRSKVFSVHTIRQFDINQVRSTPYDKFVKELNIKLPTPKQKFMEFVQIQPFNRLKNHTDFISHILRQSYQFFRMHPTQIVDGIAKKIVKIQPAQIPKNYLLILDEGSCTYNDKRIEKGKLIIRQNFDVNKFSYEGAISVIGLPYHQYCTNVSHYLNSHLPKFRKFVESIQIFKIFTQSAMQKIFSCLTLHFYIKGEILYEPGMHASDLYIIYSGSAARKIIVEIDKTNKIPIQKYSKLIKIMSRSYQHRIKFQSEDLVGVADIIDNIQTRSEDIVIDQNATIFAIDRAAIEENLDEYIVDRLRKYNLRKYPKNYDQLCQNYLKQKVENRKAEERKIEALKDEINRDSHNERKNQKIHGIIKMYRERIVEQQKEHLIDRKKLERIIHNDS